MILRPIPSIICHYWELSRTTVARNVVMVVILGILSGRIWKPAVNSVLHPMDLWPMEILWQGPAIMYVHNLILVTISQRNVLLYVQTGHGQVTHSMYVYFIVLTPHFFILLQIIRACRSVPWVITHILGQTRGKCVDHNVLEIYSLIMAHIVV